MSSMSFYHLPNAITQSLTPADAAWHQITPPAGVPANERVNVVATIVSVAAAGGAGSAVFVDFNLSGTPTIGFPILSGQTVVFSEKNNYWYKLTTSTDILYILWQW